MTARPGDLSFRATPEALAFWIHVTPRARREAVGGTHGDALRVAVRAPPAEGAANRACRAALAAAFAVRRGEVELDAASRGRRKRVHIRGDGEALARPLATLAARAGSAGGAPEP